jgi:hypothetical protein
VSIWGIASVGYAGQVEEVIGNIDREREYDWQEAEDEATYKVGFMKWLGETVQWGPLKTSRFCQGVYEILKLVME